MRVLGLATFLSFAATPFPFLLTALDRQKAVFISSAISLFVRAGLDILLTLRFGFLGPCFSVILSETVLIGLWMLELCRAGYAVALPALLWRPLAGGLAMTLVLYTFKTNVLILLAPLAVASIGAYLAAVLLLGAFSREERRFVMEGLGFAATFLDEWSQGAQKTPS
jgi:O-antigen/teichoic acid export membrane protein